MRISVAMATCNGAVYLPEQLRSITGQSRLPDEMIVSDDGSDDRTLEVLRSFASSSVFPVTILRNDERVGPGGNFARAIERCQGDWIALSDQDDVWLPNKLEVLVSYADDLAGLVFCDALLCEDSGRVTGKTQWGRLGFGRRARKRFAADPFAALLRFNVVTGMSMMFRSSLRGLVLPIPELWVHDEWIALLASAVSEVRTIDRPLAHYRQHTSQQIGGADGLIGQLRHARASIDDAYMRRAATRCKLAAERLASHGHTTGADDAPTQLTEKAAHYDRRVRPTLRQVMRDWRGGSYHRYGYGLRGVIQDLILR